MRSENGELDIGDADRCETTFYRLGLGSPKSLFQKEVRSRSTFLVGGNSTFFLYIVQVSLSRCILKSYVVRASSKRRLTRFPLRDLVRMGVEALGQLSQGLLALQRSQRDFGFEFRRVISTRSSHGSSPSLRPHRGR